MIVSIAGVETAVSKNHSSVLVSCMERFLCLEIEERKFLETVCHMECGCLECVPIFRYLEIEKTQVT